MTVPTNTPPQTATPPVESILQRLEQIEAAIAEAHSICDLMRTRDAESGEDVASGGAQDVATRCQDSLSRLNGRLTEIAANVGRI